MRGKKFDPVLAGIASCEEIPDVIGWNSRASAVVECKASLSDYRRDQKKYLEYRRGTFAMPFKRVRGRTIEGFELVAKKRMGFHRYFMCADGVIPASLVREQHPDHGLLYVTGKIVRTVIPAPARIEMRDFENEVRYLRFALVHLRDNLGQRGVTCNLIRATLYFGAQDGILFRAGMSAETAIGERQAKTPAGPSQD